MSNESHLQGNHNIVIQQVTDSTITLNVDGDVREIRNELAELKTLLLNHKSQNLQFAEKIYNIERIDEANFGFVLGKKSFNETLTKQLIEAIRSNAIPAERFLEKVAGIPNWENQLRISDKAKEIIAYSFVGPIGIQLSKLMAIGKEDFSEAKQRKYIQKCLHIAKRTLELITFALLSRLWDEQNRQPRSFETTQLDALTQRIENTFEPSIIEQFRFLQLLHQLFATPAYQLSFPLPELAHPDFVTFLSDGSDLYHVCERFQGLNDRLDKAQYDLLDCHEAEAQLAILLQHFYFLVNYRMASIRHIGYQQIRNNDPGYLHRYTALGIDSKANIDAEKINYTPSTVSTDAVLLYRGENYQDNVNLSPFVIDYNALTFEQGAKICFYRSRSIEDDSLEYLFLDDHSIVRIEPQNVHQPDANFEELMMQPDKRKALNLDLVVGQFHEAQRSLVGLGLNLDDF